MLYNEEELNAEIKRWENRLVKNCKICNGTGMIQENKDELAKMCSCMKQSLLNAHLVAAGIPRKFLGSSWDWDGFKNHKDAANKVKKYVEEFENNYFTGRGLYLYGQQGRGKTMLEALAAKDISLKINPDTEKQYKVAFIIFEELVQLSHDARSNYSARQKLNTIITKPDLLILDNLGSETGHKSDTGYVSKFLEFILRKRNNDCLPTIISSNYTPEQLKEAYTDIIYQFVEENFELVAVTGDNWRLIRGTQSNILDDNLLDEDLLGDF